MATPLLEYRKRSFTGTGPRDGALLAVDHHLRSLGRVPQLTFAITDSIIERWLSCWFVISTMPWFRL